MTPREVRMRCIEALTQNGGVREPDRLIREAAKLEEFVLGADDAAGTKGQAVKAPKTAG